MTNFFDGKGLALSGRVDRFRGITVTEIPDENFDTILGCSIPVFLQQGFRAVWLKIPSAKISAAGCAVQLHKFKIHHAKQEYIMLTRWLDNSESRLPGYATHYVGVGGLVLNSDGTKLLCIQEQNPLLPGVWKLPGGLVEANETLEAACIREVWEETGVKCEFASIVGFREMLGYQFGQQDLYFVCLLRPVSEQIDIQMTHEIAKAQWIEISELGKYKFAKMATILVELIASATKVSQGKVKLDQFPVSSFFNNCQLTGQEYKLLGKSQKFYSSELLQQISKL